MAYQGRHAVVVVLAVDVDVDANDDVLCVIVHDGRSDDIASIVEPHIRRRIDGHWRGALSGVSLGALFLFTTFGSPFENCEEGVDDDAPAWWEGDGINNTLHVMGLTRSQV